MSEGTSRREHLIEVAEELFNEHGFHQTGVDLIMKASGVSKTTLYKHFASKEDLILEVLERRSARIVSSMQGAVDDVRNSNPTAAPVDLVNAVFGVVEAWVAGGSFYGCNFVRAAAEYGSKDDRIREKALAHKHAVQDVLKDALKQNEATARQIMLVLEGGMATAQIRDPVASIKEARGLAAALL